jgi:hypothetical protein
VDRFTTKGVFAVLLSNLVSGMFFGTGCIIVEHVNSAWWPDDDNTAQVDSNPKSKVATRNSVTANDAKLLTSQPSDR